MVSTDEALAFHRARYALRQRRADQRVPVQPETIDGSLAEFKKDFGLR